MTSCVDDVSRRTNDLDLDDFSLYVKNWELAQLQSYHQSIDALAKRGLPSECCLSAPSALAEDVKTVATFTYSDGQDLAVRPGKQLIESVAQETRAIHGDLELRDFELCDLELCESEICDLGLGDLELCGLDAELYQAVMGQDTKGITNAHLRGADVDQLGRPPKTKRPLQIALDAAAYASARTLVEHGADVRFMADHESCCLKNSQPCYKPVCFVKKLYRLFVDAVASSSPQRFVKNFFCQTRDLRFGQDVYNSVLLLACRFRQSDFVTLLIKYPPEISQRPRNSRGQLFLLLAERCYRDNLRMVVGNSCRFLCSNAAADLRNLFIREFAFSREIPHSEMRAGNVSADDFDVEEPLLIMVERYRI